MSKQTGILLPRSAIHFFVSDKATEKMASELELDWRFSRIGVDVMEGNVSEAIAFYQDKPSPDLLIIETETIDKSFTDMLDDLAGVCMAHTSVIFIGPVNDIPLYRKLIDMGVTDYVVRPIKTEDMITIIANTLIDKLGTSESRFIPVLGAKGGVGTSAIAELMGFLMADKVKEKTVLMDGAGGWGALRISFGINPVMQQVEAVGVATNSTQEEVEQLLYPVSERLKVMACGGDPLLGVTMNGVEMEALVNRFMRTNPVVIADLSNAQSEAKYIAIARAHHIVLVTTPFVTSLRNSRRIIKEITDLRGGSGSIPVSLVVNMQGAAPGAEVPVKDIEETLGIKPTAIIPFNPKLFNSIIAGDKKLIQTKDGVKILESLNPIAKAIWGDYEQRGKNSKSAGSGGLNSLKGLFKKP